jgi:hypothetical protein
MAVVFIDRSREKNAQGVERRPHHRRGHQSRDHSRRVQQQLPDHRRESHRRPRTGAAAARRRLGGAPDPGGRARHRPELGQDNIDKGVHAMVFGMLAAFVFMAIYYKVFGLIADITLAANVVLLTACCPAGRGADLPGIAAVVLDRRHGGRRQHPDLRAHPRGIAQRCLAARGDCRRLRPRVLGHRRLQRDRVDRGFGAVVVRCRRGARLRVVLVLGIATSMFTAVMGSRGHWCKSFTAANARSTACRFDDRVGIRGHTWNFFTR